MPRNLTTEISPAQDTVRIGIELEGVGTVRIKWPEELGHKSIKNLEHLRAQTDFKDTLKRTPLLRSNSYDDFRGIYITPEEAQEDKLGVDHPAEMVSQPHTLDEQNLEFLRNSVYKALRSNLKGKIALSTNEQNTRYGNAPDKYPAIPNGKVPTVQSGAAFSGMYTNSGEAFPTVNIVQTIWGKQVPVLGGNLQVTCGIAVEQLFRQDPEQLSLMADFISRNEYKTRYISLVVCTLAIVEALTAQGEIFYGFADKRNELHLATYMFLLHHVAPIWKPAVGYEKCAVGANFKGGSSFVGCGVSNTNDLIPDSSYASVFAKMTDAITSTNATDKANILSTLTSPQVIELYGKPGLSCQVHFDKWFSIPNFSDAGGNLYTVVEIRQHATGMNLEMAGFLGGRLTSNQFLTRITPFVFAQH
ncbi:TPA: hypothetical protein ONA18_003959 [Pseudomonas aeruginosa]|nr:hypothetical protein [Pseudomonas aeruginosa]HBO3683730.1 hypothetical protein [Pseudomonas aeruginosa]HCD6623192.1 hypothetical protein [Pseudomonas aeruginosa]HCR1218259.1 hypothetical protein [Pseudomonas aeruginosa]HEJ1203337.1 hypothetical protein [Pseudomonas aeruginosa]